MHTIPSSGGRPLRTTPASPEALRTLPTTGRRIVDPSYTWVPDGYEVEAVIVGLSLPCGMGAAPDGTIYISEGGSTWPTRPYMPSRLLEF